MRRGTLITEAFPTANRRRRSHRGAVVLAAALLCGGCRGGYLLRLAYEEARFLGAATPATELLATTGDPERRLALEALLSVREFAASEGLDVGGSYREVADTGSVSPFHVVTAAHVDRLEPFTWWYPLIGDIPYRGYFDRESAEGFAARLRDNGLDTRIVEASAYSTLGWFDDPLPSNVLERGDVAVVVTVLHELVHQTFFAPGEVSFNETLATAVAWRLAERYYAARALPDRLARVAAAREAWLARSDVLDAAAVRLGVFFDAARREGWSRERLMAERTVLYGGILDEIALADPAFAAELGQGGLDNASFLAVYRYATGARAIDGFLASQPNLAAAFERLGTAAAAGEDLSVVVASASAP